MPLSALPGPRSVSQVYERCERKYRLVQTVKRTEDDIAALLIELDEVTLRDSVLAFETSPDKYEVYVARDSGVWERQEGYRKIKDRLRSVRRRLQEVLLEPLRLLVCVLRSDASYSESSELQAKAKEAEREHERVDYLHTKLGTSSFSSSVTQLILQRKALDTEHRGVRPSMFDTRVDCLGFQDGVYDFSARRLISGIPAQEYYVSLSVDMEYDAVISSCESRSIEDCRAFLGRIFPDASMLSYVLRRVANALRGLKEQLILIHYNVAGSNGKTTFFSLLKATLGDLFIKGNSGILSSPANPHGPNEELMSLRGKRLALFSEPSSRSRLSVAFLKELTGGDEQSARGMHAKKVTFVFMGLLNILCNKIPEFDDMDGGIKRRVRCIPYASEFVDAGSEEGNLRLSRKEANVFALDKSVDSLFPTWRLHLMRMLLDAATSADADPEPPAVLQHTRSLLEREDALGKFVAEHVVRTGNRRDVLRRDAVWTRYLVVMEGQKSRPMKYSEFNAEIALRLGEPQAKSNTTVGVIKLQLKPTSYRWQFVRSDFTGNGNFSDSGRGTCRGPGAPLPAR